MEDGTKENAGSEKKGETIPGCISALRAKRKHTAWCSYETKLKAVKLYLEEGIPSRLVAKEVGVQYGTVTKWAQDYREGGLEGLKPRDRSEVQRRRVHPAVKARIKAVKKSNPTFGIKRISQMLGRVFMLRASRETVRRTLNKERLIERGIRKVKRGPRKLHFFEADAPNRMWQSDITRFRILRNENAYLIGFIDDHSRYITGLGVYMLQKAENVLEVYRRAAGEYGAPKEMLTDNGRQYVNWRGKTEFERELKKDGVHHIRSSPHHPKTLGKIERFWKTIKEEFLDEAEFEGFEQARERIAFWVKYYNHQRPHQGIDGSCPADRYFQIQAGIRDVMEKGIEENLQDLAMKGRMEKPVYLVGRVGDNEVVVRGDNGKLRMSVDGQDRGMMKEIIIGGEKDDNTGKGKEAETGTQCDGKVPGGVEHMGGAAEAVGGVQVAGRELGGAEQLGEARDTGGDEGAGRIAGAVAGADGVGKEAGESAGAAGAGNEIGIEIRGLGNEDIQCDREVPDGADDMGGEAERCGNMQGKGGKLGVVESMAGSGDDGNAGRAGAEVAGSGAVSGAWEEAQGVAGTQGWGAGRPVSEAGETAGKFRRVCGEITGVKDERGDDRAGAACPVMDGKDRTGAKRAHDSQCCGQADGSKPEDVLPERETGTVGDAGWAFAKRLWSSGKSV